MTLEVGLAGNKALAGFRGQLLTLLTRFTFVSMGFMAGLLYLADNFLYIISIAAIPLFFACSSDRCPSYTIRTWLVISLFEANEY